MLKWKLKSIFEKAPNKADFIQKVLAALSCFLRKQFQLRHSEICKKQKNALSNAQNIRLFELNVVSKPFSKKLSMTKFWFKKFENFAWVSQKIISTSSIKNLQKAKKNPIFKRPQYWFLSSMWLQNHFLKSFLWPNFDLNSFWCFASISQKIVSTLTLKNFKKSENLPFQMLRTFVFDFMVTSKSFS